MKHAETISMVMIILALLAAVVVASCTPVFPFLGKNDAQLGPRTINEIQPPQVIQSDKPVTIIYPQKQLEQNAKMGMWQKRFWIAVGVLVFLQVVGVPVFAWLYKSMQTARRHVRELVKGSEKGLGVLEAGLQKDVKLQMAALQSPDTQREVMKIRKG